MKNNNFFYKKPLETARKKRKFMNEDFSCIWQTFQPGAAVGFSFTKKQVKIPSSIKKWQI